MDQRKLNDNANTLVDMAKVRFLYFSLCQPPPSSILLAVVAIANASVVPAWQMPCVPCRSNFRHNFKEILLHFLPCVNLTCPRLYSLWISVISIYVP